MNNMEWYKIETAPKDGTSILVVEKDGYMAIASYSEHKYYPWHNSTGCCEETLIPEFWMPLPNPPKGAEIDD